MTAGRFRYACFTLPGDSDEYERLMQLILIDDPGHHRIVYESGGWTKTGDHIVDVSYIEETDEESERY